jgi:hypothetical protein
MTAKKGEVRNPTGKGGFQDHPELRSDGGWKKENVFSYQYKRFMNMSLDELNDYRNIDPMKHLVVEELAYNAVMRAKNSLPDMKEITDRTEGKAHESLDITSGGESLVTKKLSDEELNDRIRQFIEDSSK